MPQARAMMKAGRKPAVKSTNTNTLAYAIKWEMNPIFAFARRPASR